MIRGEERWTLAREDAAARMAAAGNTGDPSRVARVIRRLDREAARPSTRDLVGRRAADELLDAAAAECFEDPMAATDVLRWNQMRHAPEQTLSDLERGPAAFGVMRLQADAPALWTALPEPRHQGVPAWHRFADAGRTWVAVQGGRHWTPPDQFPPPAAAPALPPAVAAPTAPPVEPVRPPHPDPGQPGGRDRRADRGLDR